MTLCWTAAVWPEPTRTGKTVPGGVKIKAGKLRGVPSYGMMCSIEELGSSTDMYPDADPDGLYILPDDAPVGESAIALSWAG